MKQILYLRSYDNYNASQKLNGVYRVAKALSWDIRILDIRSDTTEATILDMIKFWNPLGIIAESAAGNCSYSPKVFGRLPVVYIDRDPGEGRHVAFTVNNDSAAVARIAAQELLSLNLASYAYVPWRHKLFWCREREAAFTHFINANGHKVHRFNGICSDETMLYSEKDLGDWLRPLPRPVGIFATNDFVAQQVIAAAIRAGLSVPDDVAVVGVDNELPICENTHPTITSILPDFEYAGEAAAKLLDRIINTPNSRPAHETFGPIRLVRRESARRLAKHDPFVSQAVELIRLKACEGLTAAEVCSRFPMSRRMAEIRFRRVIGHSILDEIQRIRIEKAKELLSRPEMTDLGAITNFCGYATVAALYKVFTAAVGCSPSTWRRQRDR